jgi:gamma-glutamyl-gamma-aminobutyrate hydrolase PuuD
MNIGLTQRVLYHNNRAYDSTEYGWYSYLKDHTLFFVANRLDQDFTSLADTLDCLIITGGDDKAIRRTTELKLASQMMMQQKPILGVCHGCFLLQDILGGTITDIDNHRNTEHSVIYNDAKFNVNSYHSLSIKQLHTKGKALAIDEDNNIEAWIDNNIAGVVWHPERMETPWLPTEITKLLGI